MSPRGRAAQRARRSPRNGRRLEARPARSSRKDRLIQTRVPRQLQETLKREARRRRLTVSQLVRNLIEDAFQLVDGVVADVDQIVADSVHLARTVGATARRLAGGRSAPAGEPSAPERGLRHVVAWSEVVLRRPAACAGCGARLARGTRAFAGLSDEPGAPRAWLCAACIGPLEEVTR